MKRVLIVSDTHRRNENYLTVVNRCKPLDMVIHCGDIEGSEYVIMEAAGCPVEMVMGNNDFFSDLPREREFTLGKYHIWLTHGHNYLVSMSNETIKQEARARGIDIVMFGHSHRPVVEYDNDVIAINPGSLTYPRQEGRKPSYILMEIDESGEAHFTINYL
ncbi:MAG: metallophosphoesterase [Lachnospiraceae bacterium]|nr:metallophosphoesterase [Lachnospiraceae bacterium]